MVELSEHLACIRSTINLDMVNGLEVDIVIESDFQLDLLLGYH